MLNLFFRNLSIFTACVFSYSCSFLQTSPDSLNKDIDNWLKENQYDKIEYALNKVDTSDPAYKKILQRKPSIVQKKNRYIDKTSRIANKHKSDFKWQKSLNTYNDALNKIENNPRILKERNQLIKQRDAQVTNLRKELLINRANALISYEKTYTSLNRLMPIDHSAQKDIRLYEDEKQSLANQLTRCGELAIKKNDYKQALDCYLLSNKLMPSDTKRHFVNDIEKQLMSQENKKRFKELFKAYEVAYKKKNYNKARTPLQTIIAIEPNHKHANALLSKLNTEIKTHTANLIASGKRLYSDKKFNEALKIWKQAQALAPNNNELSQLIIRAEKVSKKLLRLEHNQ